MVRLINQHDLDAARSLSEAELIRLRAKISDLVNHAVREHDKIIGKSDENQDDPSLMSLYGALRSDKPKASDQEVSASIAAHLARENPRPGP